MALASAVPVDGMSRAGTSPSPFVALRALRRLFSVPLTWPKQCRLTRRPQFTACYDRGERHYTRYFVVFTLERSADSPPGSGRVGLAVTRKCGNAVERNRIKRVLREFFRLHRQNMPVMDIVVTPKRHLRADKVRLAFVERELAPLLDTLRAASGPRDAGRAARRPQIRNGEPA